MRPAVRSRRDGSYVADGAALGAGSTLGGPDLCVVVKANGSLDRVVSVAAGTTLLAGLDLRFWLPESALRLARRRGRFVLEPAVQTYRYRLGRDLQGEERIFVLDDGTVDVAACYVSLRLRNRGTLPRRVATLAIASLAAQFTDAEIAVQYDAGLRALIVEHRERPGETRLIAASRPPASYAVTADHARALDERWGGALDGTIDTRGSDPLGMLQLENELAPGADVELAFVVVPLPEGPASAGRALAALPSADDALARTRRRYEAALRQARLLAPDRTVEHGVRWAKANMLRVLRSTPTGPGFTNDPGNSTHCVGRDAAWFVHGCDWLEPAFSLALLRAFAARQERDGKIVEFYDLRGGVTEDDGLDVNDNTPLFVLAVWHHVVAGGDRERLAELYPAAARAGEQLLAHRDERGLVWCSARGTGARGIAGWRNVIDGYRISGATTEINSEAYGAFAKLGELAEALDRDDEAERWRTAALELRAAIERHLRNPENGLYYLAIDVDGARRSELSCDVLFPVVFGVCDDATSARIVTRLRHADFWTDAGVRTVPRDAPEYHPTRGSGLLGGVWVAVNFWYAFAAAEFFPEVMANALAFSFAHYARRPRATNTVPGQFAEWLHGETLANQGMQLSPWFAPRYVWAAIEGAAGLQPSIDRIRIAPHIPPGWNWIAACDVPVHGRPVSWIVARMPELRVFATADVESDLPVVRYERDASADVRVEGEDCAVVAFAGPARSLVFVGNREARTIVAAVVLNGAFAGRRAARRFSYARSAWTELDEEPGGVLRVDVPPRGFTLIELVGSP